jgi:putative ABC transport system permease protein
VGWFEIRIEDPLRAVPMAQKIDALFANSANETKTQPSKDFIVAFIKQRGDIAFVLHAILGAVFFSLLILTGNTMIQSLRERVPELAVLKTLGFTDRGIFALLLAESLLLCVSAAFLGLLLSYTLLPTVESALQGVELTGGMLLPGILVAVALALVVGLPPAIRANRLKIVDALADKR